MDARQEKAREILAGGRIEQGKGCWLVPSQSGAGRHKVTVDGLFPTCSCADHELTGGECKHILAVRLFLDAQAKGETVPQQTEPAPKAKRPTYRQDWPNYNLAQNHEKAHFCPLLADLCRLIIEPPPKGGSKGGRPPVLLADAVFAAVYKVYVGFSARRFMTDLEEARERGYLSRRLCHNSVLKALEKSALTPILKELVRVSALPLAAVETDFAVDSSGFCTSRFIRWFDVKYGVTRETADWVKCHISVGVKTNAVAAVEILERRTADVSQLPGLVNTTSRGFTVREVSADKAYAATDNFEAVEAVGGTLYAAFKSNTTGAVGGLFEKAFHYFCLHREEFLKHYHKRSNVESTFSMINRKHGDSVRSKTDTAMVNEVLCKLLAHNLCCLISAWYELGIDPVFAPAAPDDEPPAVLPFVRRG